MGELSLGERIKLALHGPPRRTQRALAAAVGISPVSVNDWVSDRTKSIEGAHLLKAAAFLGVSPRWLAEGVGPMTAGPVDEAPAAIASIDWRTLAHTMADDMPQGAVRDCIVAFLTNVDEMAAAKAKLASLSLAPRSNPSQHRKAKGD